MFTIIEKEMCDIIEKDTSFSAFEIVQN